MPTPSASVLGANSGGIRPGNGSVTNLSTTPSSAGGATIAGNTSSDLYGNTKSASPSKEVPPAADINEKARDELGEYVRNEFADLLAGRSLIDELLLKCLRQRQ